MPDGSSTGIGVSVKRKEDYRFLVGEGKYTDDINRPNQTYSYMLRSNSAHANFSLNIENASKLKGVVKIFVGEDMEVGGIPCGWQVDSKDGTPMREPAHPPIAKKQG
jgi:carbon-monoxide dehydrogenase large subunit